MNCCSIFCYQNIVKDVINTDHKNNEITVIPLPLDLLELNGCFKTFYAMEYQRDIAEKIVDNGADYLLAVTENQGKLHDALKKYLSTEEIVRLKC